MGFMPILLVTGLNIDLGYLPQSSTRMFAVCYAILFGAFSVIFFNEIFNNENKMVPKSTVITKKQYTSYYNCYSVLVVALIQGYFITKKQYFVITIVSVMLVFTVLSLRKKWYRNCLQRFCLMLNNLVLMLSIVLVLLIEKSLIEEKDFNLIAYIHVAMVAFIELNATLRIIQQLFIAVRKIYASKQTKKQQKSK